MEPFYCFLVVTYVINFAIGFLGNVLVILYLHDSLKKARQFNKSLGKILLNLAVVDILTEVFGIIAVLLEYDVIKHPEGVTGDVVCKILTSHTLTWTFTNISVLTVVLLAWERYRAVTQFKSKLASPDEEVRYMKYLIAAFWFIGSAMYSPFIPFQIYDSEEGCHEKFPNSAAKYGIPLMDITCFYILPSIFFVYAYANIVLSLKKPPKDMSARRRKQFSYSKVRRRLTLTAMLIVGGFFACWSGAYTIYTIQVIGDLDNKALDTTYEIAIIFAYFASTSHPIIYSFRSKHFRNKVKSIIKEAHIEDCLVRIASCWCSQKVQPADAYIVRKTEETEMGNQEKISQTEGDTTEGAQSNGLFESTNE